MSNILTPFKKFFKNKNTVTIMCIFLGVLTLVIGYNYRVSVATDLVTVPYALKEIPKKTQITKDMIGHVKIPASFKDNLLYTIGPDLYSSDETNGKACIKYFNSIVDKLLKLKQDIKFDANIKNTTLIELLQLARG